MARMIDCNSFSAEEGEKDSNLSHSKQMRVYQDLQSRNMRDEYVEMVVCPNFYYGGQT